MVLVLVIGVVVGIKGFEFMCGHGVLYWVTVMLKEGDDSGGGDPQ